jgi:hypothetical protein
VDLLEPEAVNPRLPPPLIAALVLGMANLPEGELQKPTPVDPEDQAIRERYRAERIARKAEAVAKAAARRKP